MADDLVPPVKVLIKAIDTGTKLAIKIFESANDSSSGNALQISQAAHALLTSLERSSQTIREAYKQNVAICGAPFTRALIDDRTYPLAIHILLC